MQSEEGDVVVECEEGDVVVERDSESVRAREDDLSISTQGLREGVREGERGRLHPTEGRGREQCRA